MKTIEWAAGLFEGEGTICQNKAGTNFVQLTMTDKDVVEMFGEAIGCGKLYQLATLKSGKESWRWSVHRKQDVRNVLAKMLPHFGNRRAHRALDCLDNIELN